MKFLKQVQKEFVTVFDIFLPLPPSRDIFKSLLIMWDELARKFLFKPNISLHF